MGDQLTFLTGFLLILPWFPDMIQTCDPKAKGASMLTLPNMHVLPSSLSGLVNLTCNLRICLCRFEASFQRVARMATLYNFIVPADTLYIAHMESGCT